MQFNGLDDVNNFFFMCCKHIDHGSNVANPVAVKLLVVIYCNKNKDRRKPEKNAREGNYSAYEHITYEMLSVFVLYKIGHRLSAHSSRQGSLNSIIIDRFDVLSEWKV